MAADFLVPVKSTLDKLMFDLRASIAADNPTDYASLQAVDVDDIVDTDDIVKAVKPTLLWQHLSLDPKPKDPLYQCEFMVGAKTSGDKGNYLLTDLVMRLQQAFKVDTLLQVEDYSGASAIPDQGYLVVTSLAQAPQMFENQSGIRMWQVAALGARKVP